MLIHEIEAITSERGRDYGHPLPNHLHISLEWSLDDFPFVHNPIGVASKTDLLKSARNRETPKWDNYRDKMGYINCIDKMCELYWNLSRDVKVKSYSDLDDSGKIALVKELKSMSFGQQYDLLVKSATYLNNQSNAQGQTS